MMMMIQTKRESKRSRANRKTYQYALLVLIGNEISANGDIPVYFAIPDWKRNEDIPVCLAVPEWERNEDIPMCCAVPEWQRN